MTSEVTEFQRVQWEILGSVTSVQYPLSELRQSLQQIQSDQISPTICVVVLSITQITEQKAFLFLDL